MSEKNQGSSGYFTENRAGAQYRLARAGAYAAQAAVKRAQSSASR